MGWNRIVIQINPKQKDMMSEDFLNSSPPSVAYMRWWIGSALVQVMACRLSVAKPLPERYCQLDPKLSKIRIEKKNTFYS